MFTIKAENEKMRLLKQNNIYWSAPQFFRNFLQIRKQESTLTSTFLDDATMHQGKISIAKELEIFF